MHGEDGGAGRAGKVHVRAQISQREPAQFSSVAQRVTAEYACAGAAFPGYHELVRHHAA